MVKKSYRIIECPRDAMQGWNNFIPTQKKIEYINTLLQVGFDTIDFGSFVSPKAIPQMADTAEVLKGLKLQNSRSKLLAIIANLRGATDAVAFEKIDYLGFPFSISPTFQLRNSNSTIAQSIETVTEIQELCIKNKKNLVVYLSMAFGNPYNDLYNNEMLLEYAEIIKNLDVKIISLADTVGVATPNQIKTVLQSLIPTYTDIEFGIHLHTSATNWKDKLEAATGSGCRRIDGAINGIGGCPMADDVLVGNLATENILSYLQEIQQAQTINEIALEKAKQLAKQIFI